MAHIIKIHGPPGTGKTTHLLGIVEQEMAAGIHPSEIAYVSFTRAAAHEARNRALARFTQFKAEDFPYFATVHSIAYRLLGLYNSQVFTGKRIGEFAKECRYVLTPQDRVGMEQAMLDFDVQKEADVYEFFVQWQKDTMTWDTYEAWRKFQQRQIDVPHECSFAGLQAYVERRNRYKREHRLWDFGDFLTSVGGMPFAPKILIIDEAQDNSPALWNVLQAWMQGVERVFLAGDVYQTLYTFSGAAPELMLDLKADETTTLKQSYRCCQVVHDLARKVVSRMHVRYPDDDFLPTAELGEVVKSGLPADGGSTFLQARTRYLLDRHYELLLARGIPFITRRGHKSPLEKDIGWLVAVLLQVKGSEGICIGDALRLAKLLPQKGNMRRGTRNAVALVMQEQPSLVLGMRGLAGLGFEQELFRRDPFELPLAPAEERAYLRKVYSAHGIGVKPNLCLGTYHSFKGMEADNVVLDLGLTKRPWYNLQLHSDEEHRIFYTGVTRARHRVCFDIGNSPWAYPLGG